MSDFQGSRVSTFGGGVKMENLWNKKKTPNQLGWLSICETHKGLKTTKQSPSRFSPLHLVNNQLSYTFESISKTKEI